MLTERMLQIDGVTLDARNDQVTGPSGTHHLTRMERRLLQVLMLHPGQVVPVVCDPHLIGLRVADGLGNRRDAVV